MSTSWMPLLQVLYQEEHPQCTSPIILLTSPLSDTPTFSDSSTIHSVQTFSPPSYLPVGDTVSVYPTKLFSYLPLLCRDSPTTPVPIWMTVKRENSVLTSSIRKATSGTHLLQSPRTLDTPPTLPGTPSVTTIEIDQEG